MKKKEEKAPSEVIQDFLNYLKYCQGEYIKALAIVEEESAKEQDFFHAMEFESNGNKLAKIARELHNSRVRRRENKNIVEKYHVIYKFTINEKNKQMIGQFKTLLSDQQKEESKMACNKRYHPRTEYGKELLKDFVSTEKEGEPNDNT